MDIGTISSYVLAVVIGVILAVLFYTFTNNRAKRAALKSIEDAKQRADAIIKEAILDGKTRAYELKIETEKTLNEKKQEIAHSESILLQREQGIDRRDLALQNRESLLDQENQRVKEKYSELSKKEEEINERNNQILSELERIASLTVNDAKELIRKEAQSQVEKEMVTFIRDQEEEAKAKANDNAREIIAHAMQRYAQEATVERNVSVVPLASEEMKGRIIGREGRNIKALELATGVDLIIDDTPEAITISSFDPIRREIARQSIEKLLSDGRIHPGRIEEIVERVRTELDETMRKAGEDATFQLGIAKVDREIISLLGKLKYRTSYGQNALQHSLEVAHLSGIMAAELGLNQQLAKRAGLLHDLGKSVDYEIEGSHVEIGSRLAKKYGENDIVINAIESHHGDTQTTSIISVLVAIADTLSAARPGARLESFENYIQRLEKLEKITNSYDGVDKSFAIQAGREVRVMVKPDKLDDEKCYQLARDIKEKIENELTYPGQIKVTVIREIRANEIAK